MDVRHCDVDVSSVGGVRTVVAHKCGGNGRGVFDPYLLESTSAIALDRPRRPTPCAASPTALPNPEASPSQRHESTEASCTNAYPKTIALFQKMSMRDAESGAV